MRHLYRNTILVLVIILLSVYAILPPDTQLRRAKDLAGGVSLVYQVELKPTDASDTISRMIDLLKGRVDPSNQFDITMEQLGSSRIQITMPLPTPKVQSLRAAYDKAVEALGQGALSAEQFASVMTLPADQRGARLTEMAAGDAERLKLLQAAAAAYDASEAARADFAARRGDLQKAIDEAEARLKQAQGAGAPVTELDPLTKARDDAEAAFTGAARAVAQTQADFGKARDAALATAIDPASVRRIFELSDKDLPLRERGPDGKFMFMESPRKQAIARLKASHPAASARIDEVIARHAEYAKFRKSLDDPEDLKRMLRGAGVLDFRIGVRASDTIVSPDRIATLRDQLSRGGPGAVRDPELGWYRLNKLEGWFDSRADAQALVTDPISYFASRYDMVATSFDGQIYLLLWNAPGSRLTQNEGSWRVSSARQSADQLGRPSIAFNMDALGADKMRRLTGNNIRKPMAVLLDDQVYTAPNINGAIGGSGVIEGSFTPDEINYVVRVLAAGSLAAKLSPEPISVQTIGPELGADNLQRGLYAGVVSFVLVAGFIVVYYWSGGVIAVFALAVNALLILAIMAINRSAFSLPGIAGIILTFGMAVDANVLIFERMREELQRGHDLRTAVRLGYAKAMSAIVDGNITNLIVCVVLGFMGTQEIKGFAITMSIGVLTTLFAQLYVTRVIYFWLIEKAHWRKIGMLPLAIPALQRAITPNIDWLKYRYFFYVFSIIVTILAVGVVVSRGASVLDTEFRGGTKLTLQFRNDDAGNRLTMTRAEVENRVQAITSDRLDAEGLSALRSSEVLAINPAADRVTSGTFQIKTTLRDAEAVRDLITQTFKDKLDVQAKLRYVGAGEPELAAERVLPVPVADLARVLERLSPASKGWRTDTVIPDQYINGAVVVLENISPGPVSIRQLEQRINAFRNDPQFSTAATRAHQWVVLDGDENNVKSVAFLVSDPTVRYADDQQRWNREMRDREWELFDAALGRDQSIASVEEFSAAIARTFVNQAIVAILLSALMITIYVWVRFNSFRYSLAAILSTLHDCFVAVGAIAVAEIIYESSPGAAATLGILPFKIDLNVIAAVLTLLGYSLNDTIVILDRIRENRGKLPYASRAMVNLSVNQTFSRTIMTGGSVIVATLVIYLMAGEAIRPFAFCFLVGVLTGTYSSVAIAAPLAWSKKLDVTAGGQPPAAPAGPGPGPGALPST